MRYIFPAPSQEPDQTTNGRDDLTADKLDVVVGYVHNPMHDIMSGKGNKDETKWWEDDSIASGTFDGNAFVPRVLDQLGRPRSAARRKSPHIWQYREDRTKCGIHRLSGASKDLHALDPEQDQVHQSEDSHVRSMVQVPTKTKAFADGDPLVRALREKIKGDYARNFFSLRPTKDPPIPGAYGEA